MIFRSLVHFSFIILCIISCVLLFAPTLYAQEDVDEFVRKIQDQDIRLYEQIHSLKFKSHVKTYFYVGYNPLSLSIVPYLEEYYADGVWTKPDSLRLTISALRVVVPEDASNPLDSIGTDLPLPNPMQFSNAPSLFGFEDQNHNHGHNEKDKNDDNGAEREEK